MMSHAKVQTYAWVEYESIRGGYRRVRFVVVPYQGFFGQHIMSPCGGWKLPTSMPYADKVCVHDYPSRTRKGSGRKIYCDFIASLQTIKEALEIYIEKNYSPKPNTVKVAFE